jgi:uncharacterized protein (TIGR00251 family)
MSRSVVNEVRDGCLVTVRVKPSSGKREFIGEITEEYVLVNLKSPARGGKANSELLKRIAKLLAVSTIDVEIVAGKQTRNKVILVRKMTANDILIRLNQT